MFRTPFAIAAAAAAAALALAGCAGGSNAGQAGASPSATSAGTSTAFQTPGPNDKGGKNNPVSIGVVGASQSQWTVLKSDAQKAGIYVKLVDFTDYQQPNPAVADGSLDVNQFQHILFLAQYNNESGANLQPFGSTAIYPLALYSKKYKSVDQIPQGSQIAVPNDGTNQARALGVLSAAKLITLKSGTKSLSASPADVDQGASKVSVSPVAADQTGRSLDDPKIAGAVINNDYVKDTGLDPNSAIAEDDPNSAAAQPFINIWATKADQANNPVYLKLVQIAHGPDVEKQLVENSGGTGVIVNKSAAQLQKILTDAENQLKSQG